MIDRFERRIVDVPACRVAGAPTTQAFWMIIREDNEQIYRLLTKVPC